MKIKPAIQAKTQTKKFTKTVLSLALIQALTCGSSMAVAANIIVDSASDVIDTNDGNCTFREAIAAADNDAAVDTCVAGNGDDTITFDNTLSDSKITLGSQINLLENVTIDGDLDDNGTPDIEISGGNNNRIIRLAPAALTKTFNFDGVTLSEGSTSEDGGALWCQTDYAGIYCNINISNSVITGNTALQRGGAISSGTDSNLSLTNSTLSNNTATLSGGAINQNGGVLTLTNSTVSENRVLGDGGFMYTGPGGGIYAFTAAINISGSTLSGNTANGSGGAITSLRTAAMDITNSTLSGNSAATGYGGAIYSYSSTGTVSISGSTISNNSSQLAGGGVTVYYDSLVIKNSTISGNTSSSMAGGVMSSYGDIAISNSTITNNTAETIGGGIFAYYSSPFNLTNTILANNTVSGNVLDDCNASSANTMDTDLNNLVTDGGSGLCRISPVSTADPQLGLLADNGGATFTHLPAAGSPVIDAGDNTNCGSGKTISTDQRGVARDDGACDIGAVEGSFAFTPSQVQFDSTTVSVSEDSGSITLTVTRSGGLGAEFSIDYATSDGTATAPGDYTADMNTLNFASGETSQTVILDITNDAEVENDENFSVNLSNIQLVSGNGIVELGTNTSSTVTITNDDVAATGSSGSSSGSLSPWWMLLGFLSYLRRKAK